MVAYYCSTHPKLHASVQETNCSCDTFICIHHCHYNCTLLILCVTVFRSFYSYLFKIFIISLFLKQIVIFPSSTLLLPYYNFYLFTCSREDDIETHGWMTLSNNSSPRSESKSENFMALQYNSI